MSRKEFERGAIFGRVAAGEACLIEVVDLLGISYRQAKRLYARYRRDGTAGLVHGNVGRRSNRSRPECDRERALAVVQAEYGGTRKRAAGQRFGPTLAAEHLLEEHGLAIPRTTLRDWMLEAGLWSRIRRSRPRPKRRERKLHFGELVQMDGSFHDWFEGRGSRAGRRSCMMSMVDDATGTTLLRFGDQETIWAAVRILRDWIRCYGVPRALYTDWKNVYKREPTAREKALGIEARTHFGRICSKLGIEIIAASSARAKGRVERNHGTQQDRLIKKMRRAAISEDGVANEYLETTYLPQYNARFEIIPASDVDFHLPVDPHLHADDVFCLEHSRIVGNDFVVQFEGRALQLERLARGQVPAGSRVLVRETEDGRLRVIFVRADDTERVCRWSPAPERTKGRGAPISQPSRATGLRPAGQPARAHPWRSMGQFRSELQTAASG